MAVEAIRGLDDAVTLPVVEINSPRGRTRGPFILLTSTTEKPIDGFSNNFWRQFRDHAIKVLKRNFYDRLRDHILVLPFMFHFWIGPITAVDSLHSAALTVYLTGAYFVHSGMAKEFFNIVATVLYAVEAVMFGLLFLCFQWYIDSVLLFVLGVISCYTFLPRIPELQADIHSFLRTVNIYCQSQLDGYGIEFTHKRTRSGIEYSFVFQRRRQADDVADIGGPTRFGHVGAASVAGVSTINDGKLQFRVLLYDPTISWFKIFGKQKNVGEAYLLSTTPITSSPSGISPEAWIEFVNDFSDEIQTQDAFLKKTLVIVVVYSVISIAGFLVYGAVNYLLPLHLTSPLIAVVISRRMIERKLKVINLFEGITFSSSTSYNLSYKAVRWYSRCDDYILFQRRDGNEGSNQGGSAVHQPSR